MKKNEKFDLNDFVPYLLNHAAEVSSLQFQSYYKTKYGILRTEWRVIFHLGRSGKMTAKEICLYTHSHKTKISRAVASLIKRGFISRERKKEDNRSDLLFLTQEGQKVYEDLRNEAQKFEVKLLNDLTNEECETFRYCLRKIISK